MFLLSYVIQNFYNVNQSLVLNQKLYLIWINRNSPLILTFINKNWILLINNLSCLNNSRSLYQLTRFFFNTGFYMLFKTLLTKWKPFLTTNYTKSLQYWVFKLNISLISKQVINSNLINVESVLLHNQYFTSIVISNISLHNKYYRIVMLKFINMLILPWQLWNRNYNISFKFLLLTKNFNLIRYYNTYFFKIYNF
jgi:hypothetical protein